MKKESPTFEVNNKYEDVNKFLLGTAAALRRKEIELDDAIAISQLCDKVVKNNLTKILDDKRTGNKDENPYFALDNKVLIG